MIGDAGYPILLSQKALAELDIWIKRQPSPRPTRSQVLEVIVVERLQADRIWREREDADRAQERKDEEDGAEWCRLHREDPDQLADQMEAMAKEFDENWSGSSPIPKISSFDKKYIRWLRDCGIAIRSGKRRPALRHYCASF